jgi:hypothetical protein
MGDPWLRLIDNARGVPYWQNFATNEITYDEPEEELAHEKNMIGKRVKIYWVVQVGAFMLRIFFSLLLQWSWTCMMTSVQMCTLSLCVCTAP